MLSLLVTLATLSASLESPLVTPAWLAGRLGRADLVVMHVGDARARDGYDRGHIPGAVFINPFTDLARPAAQGQLTLELPDAAQLEEALRSRGIGTTSTVVLYTADANLTGTARAFFTLEYAGLTNRVRLLDGGLAAWQGEGRPLSTVAPAPARGDFVPQLQPNMLVSADWVASRLEDPSTAIVDARAPAFYRGAENRQARVGHIPGAGSLPFTAITGTDGRFKDSGTLTTLLGAAGAESGNTVVTYCHIGQQASLVWLGARVAGFEAKLYDGSFQEWSARFDLPVALPPPSVNDSLLVSAAWLLARLTDPDLIILHADRAPTTYDAGHIPGAQFVALADYTVNQPLSTQLPPVDQLRALVQRLGIHATSRIVITGEPLPAARLFFTLDYLGLGDRVAMLDGGLVGWRAAGHGLSTTVQAMRPGTVEPRPFAGLILSADSVNTIRLNPTVALVDARAPDEFDGSRPDTSLARRGHIPGSTNLEWTRLMDGPRLRPAAELRQMLETAGAAPTDLLITTCGTGYRASMLYFVARYLGYRVRMYDGAWAEWNRRADLPAAP